MLNQYERPRPERRSANGKITVLVASAVTEKRRRWENRLQDAYAICEVGERRALEQIMRHLKPHVLLLDLCLPGLGGVRHVARIQRLSPRTKIIALATRADDREGVSALEKSSHLHAYTINAADGDAKLKDGSLAAYIVFPADFSQQALGKVVAPEVHLEHRDRQAGGLESRDDRRAVQLENAGVGHEHRA